MKNSSCSSSVSRACCKACAHRSVHGLSVKVTSPCFISAIPVPQEVLFCSRPIINPGTRQKRAMSAIWKFRGSTMNPESLIVPISVTSTPCVRSMALERFDQPA